MRRNNLPRLLRSIAMAIAVVIALAAGRASASAKPEVRDGAHLFDAATIERVNATVREIQKKFGKDLTIETFSVIPETMQPSFAAQTKEQFYEGWLNREAVAADTNGVFILIVKDPGHLEIGVGKRTRGKTFTNADRDALRDLMLKQLHEHKYDDAIAEGAAFVLHRMEDNQAGTTRNAEVTPPATAPASVILQVPPSPATQPAAAPKNDTDRADANPPTATPPSTEPKPATEVKPAAPGSVELNK